MEDRQKTLAALTIIVGVIVLFILLVGAFVSGKKIVSPVPEEGAIKIIFVTPTPPAKQDLALPDTPTPTPTKKITPKPTPKATGSAKQNLAPPGSATPTPTKTPTPTPTKTPTPTPTVKP